MNSETQRLAIIATICFFPTAIVGWALNRNSPEVAARLFRWSVFIFLVILGAAGFYAVTSGEKVVEALGTFY
jgi:uncharacterized membrane protein